jgi:hypothetical protein
MRIVAVFGLGIGQEVRRAAAVERRPVAPRVARLEHAAADMPM